MQILTPHVFASTFVDTIVVGEAPSGMSITPDGSKLYVVNNTSYSVNVIDTATNSIIKTIPLTAGSKPQSSAISPDGTEIYITERSTGKVKVISTITDSVVATIDTPSSLIFGITFTPDGSKAYISSANVFGTIRMSIIDTASRSVVDYIDTIDPQEQIVFSPDGNTGYIPQQKQSNTSILFTDVINLDTKTVIGTIVDTWVVRIFNNGLFAWGFDQFGNTFDFIDLTTNTILERIPITSSPTLEGVKMHPDERYTYFVNRTSSTVTVIDNASKAIIEVIPVTGPLPNAIVVTPNGEYLYVAHPETDTVDVVLLGQLNNPPAISIPELGGDMTISVAEGNSISFTVQKNDPNGDAVTLSAEDVPSGALFNQSTGAFSWTPSSSMAGEHVVSFTATDTGVPALSSSVEVHITVTDVPVDEKDMFDLIRELIGAIET